jgi:hypothetical protein
VLTIGVDEAGYGPLLGPLVIGCCAMRVDPTRAGSDAWREDLRPRLRGIVATARRVSRDDCAALPVPVDDSKRIRARYGLTGLARGVGAFAAAMDQAPPADLDDLLMRYSDRDPESYADAPWFAALDGAPVPRYPWTGPLHDRLARRGLQALDLRVLPADAHELNRSFAAFNNKANVLGVLSATLLLSVLDRYPGEDALVVMDRQGGRTDYASYLARIFPFAHVLSRPAPRGESRYRVDLPGRRLRMRFVTRGDRVSLAVGWASMAAKLTRDLFMQRLNAWFGAFRPALRPTAGYHPDGRRFLADLGTLLDDEAIDTALLVRSR